VKIPLRQYWNLLHQYLKPQWKQVALLAVLLLGSILLRVINPQLIRHFIDAATAGDSLSQLIMAAVIFLIFAGMIQFLGVTSTYIGENIGWVATNNLRADLARFCLRLDMSFHNDRTPGEMIERIDGDVIDLAVFFAQFAIKILANLLLLGGILLALYIEDWRIGLALTIYSIMSLYALNRLRDIAVPHWKGAREASADLYGFVEEQLSGTEDIRSSGAVDYTMDKLYRFGWINFTALNGNMC
jgi:ABC-type multidrug transport system fused ATPase/permease subunit